MTDEELAKAEAEYEALPGTPPDGWSFIPVAELTNAVMQERLESWRPEMNHARCTDMTGEFAREGWPEGCALGLVVGCADGCPLG